MLGLPSFYSKQYTHVSVLKPRCSETSRRLLASVYNLLDSSACSRNDRIAVHLNRLYCVFSPESLHSFWRWFYCRIPIELLRWEKISKNQNSEPENSTRSPDKILSLRYGLKTTMCFIILIEFLEFKNNWAPKLRTFFLLPSCIKTALEISLWENQIESKFLTTNFTQNISPKSSSTLLQIQPKNSD